VVQQEPQVLQARQVRPVIQEELDQAVPAAATAAQVLLVLQVILGPMVLQVIQALQELMAHREYPEIMDHLVMPVRPAEMVIQEQAEA
jgi:hypothetical protein